MDDFMYWDHPGWFMMLSLHSVLWVGLLVLLIVGISLIIRSHVRGQAQPGNSPATNLESAQDILDDRYARGEIDREEYLQRKQDLTQ